MHAVSKPFAALALTQAVASSCPGRGGTPSQTCDRSSAITHASMRRLPRFECDNTVRDLELDRFGVLWSCAAQVADATAEPTGARTIAGVMFVGSEFAIPNLFGDTRTTSDHEEFCMGALAGVTA